MNIRLLFLVLWSMVAGAAQAGSIHVITGAESGEKEKYAAEVLQKQLAASGYEVMMSSYTGKLPRGRHIVLVNREQASTAALLKKLKVELPSDMKKEGFHIRTRGNTTLVCGTDGNGVIYGSRELIDRLQDPAEEDFPATMTDAPEMVLRGTAIGIQKPYYLPGRTVYEYPYTPEVFPWLYDKAQWIEYLDMLVANRMNSLYLWNGHPFASLVRLKDYPFAVEVDEATFRKNEEIFSFLTHEAGKRGIFVIQMFYNIIVSKPFAEHYGIPTQERHVKITPLLKDYTRKSIAEFIRKYPNVGLLVCLGEAMSTIEDDVMWFNETIIPGVKDGLKALGRTDEPPILLRAHDTDAPAVMQAALPHYKNLYTMHKYNGESLTTYEPRGPWTKIHTDLSSLGSIHISNVHILANLEPWRYGSPWFIQKTVNAMHTIHGANALHLYPQASYWDYPYTADKLPDGSRLKQTERDWIWFKAWGRYAWKEGRERADEISYWNRQLEDYYGVSTQEARQIQTAYDETGEIAPKLLRRFGITEGNRQTLLLGMFMSQLVNPYKYKIYPGFYESCGPEGEKLIEYVEKKWKNQPHVGELPLDIVSQTIEHGDKALAAMEQVKGATRNTAELERLRNDIRCYREFAHFFGNKVKAAELVLDYQWGKDTGKLDAAIPFLEASLKHYEKLVELTRDSYLYANSMQTAQRRIPIGGDDGKNKTWEELLVHYKKELVNYRNNLALLKDKSKGQPGRTVVALKPGKVSLMSTSPGTGNESTADSKNQQAEKADPGTPNIETFGKTTLLQKGVSLYPDLSSEILEIAPELTGLQALVFSAEEQKQGTSIRFSCDKPVTLLVGYFRDDQSKYAKAPTLETDASANLYGQSDPVITNAIRFAGLPAVNIHAYRFEAGQHQLNLPRGLIVVPGFTSDVPQVRNAGLAGTGEEETMDWMFY